MTFLCETQQISSLSLLLVHNLITIVVWIKTIWYIEGYVYVLLLNGWFGPATSTVHTRLFVCVAFRVTVEPKTVRNVGASLLSSSMIKLEYRDQN